MSGMRFENNFVQQSGMELRREFLRKWKEWTALRKTMSDVADGLPSSTDESVTRVLREFITLGTELDQMYDQISLELGLPIVHR